MTSTSVTKEDVPEGGGGKSERACKSKRRKSDLVLFKSETG